MFTCNLKNLLLVKRNLPPEETQRMLLRAIFTQKRDRNIHKRDLQTHKREFRGVCTAANPPTLLPAEILQKKIGALDSLYIFKLSKAPIVNHLTN